MRQIVFEALGRVGVHEAPPPAPPGPGEVLVEPAFLGVCGTDLHVLHGKHPWVRPPVVTGHEMAGRVLGAGPGITDLQPGQAVVLNPLVTCGVCRQCRRGAMNRCEAGKVSGFRLPGAGQTALVVGSAQLHTVPDGMSLEAAVLAEPLAVGVHAAGLWDDLEDVLVIGGGTIGQCVLAGLRARGAARVTLIEPVAAKRALALRLGAAAAVAPGEVAAQPRFTATFDVVAAPATLELAAASTLSGGAIIVVGVAAGPVPLALPRMQRFEIALLGSGMYLPADIDAALLLLAAGAVDPAVFVSNVRPLDEAPAAYADAAQPDTIKTLIRMS